MRTPMREILRRKLPAKPSVLVASPPSLENPDGLWFHHADGERLWIRKRSRLGSCARAPQCRYDSSNYDVPRYVLAWQRQRLSPAQLHNRLLRALRKTSKPPPPDIRARIGHKQSLCLFNHGRIWDTGASLRAWKDLFPNALIYGADIDRDILFEDKGIQTFYCDQLDRAAIDELWSQPALRGGMDIIIDDGLHTFEANHSFFEGSIGQLRPGGVYVIEDILTSELGQWRHQLETNYSKRFSDCDFALMELPNSKNSFDNNLLVVRRR